MALQERSFLNQRLVQAILNTMLQHKALRVCTDHAAARGCWLLALRWHRLPGLRTEVRSSWLRSRTTKFLR